MSSNIDISQLSKLRVLYVEDDQAIRESLSNFLRRRIKHLFIAKDGQEGLELFRSERPDIIITDIRMPHLDGLEMSAEIRKENKSVQIIVTTAHSETNYFLDAIDVGVNQFIIKPVNKDKFERALAKSADAIILEKKVKEQSILIQQILDFQDNIIFLSTGSEVIEVNKSFFNFFNYSNLEDFRKEHKCVCEFFIEAEGYIFNKQNSNWLTYLVNNPNERHKVLMHDTKKDEERTFLIKQTKLPNDEDIYIISLTDITDIINESKTFETLANTDPLTKIFNRMKFNICLESEIERFNRYSIPFSMIMFDIDHFKKINDVYGHQVGDSVLVNLVELIKGHIRKTDIFARWGGEEFMILAPSTDIEGAFASAQHLRSVVEEFKFDGVERVTISIGVTEFYINDTLQVDSIISRVDNALYCAKGNGRNIVKKFTLNEHKMRVVNG